MRRLSRGMKIVYENKQKLKQKQTYCILSVKPLQSKPTKPEFRRWTGRGGRNFSSLAPGHSLYNGLMDVPLSIEVSVKGIKPRVKRWISN